MRFQIIVCDPPWQFNDKLDAMKNPVKRGAASQYPVLTLSTIKYLRVQDVADPEGCLLALWVPGSMLEHGLAAMSNWGFAYKQIFVWVKTKKDCLTLETDMNKMTRVGMGRLFRQSHEIAIIGTMGRVYKLLEDKSQRSVAFDPNQGHSIKPGTLQMRLEKMFPKARKLEMFARRLRPGWESWGDEIDGKDIRDAIQDHVDLIESAETVIDMQENEDE